MTGAVRAMDNTRSEKLAFENDHWLWEKHYPEGLSWYAPILRKPLFHVLDQALEKYPDNDLCDFQGRAFTYREMGRYVDRIAEGLQKLGVKKGIKVGIFLPNTPYSIMFFYGILKAGATVVNYNPLYVERELSGQIEDSETDIMVTADLQFLIDKMERMLVTTRLKKVVVCPIAEVLPFAKKLLYPIVKARDIAKVPANERYIWLKDLTDNHGKPEPVVVDADNDIAVLQYTGGTTGTPKGAMLTHGSIYANVQQTTYWVNSIEPGKDTIIGVLPFFHVFAMTIVMNCSIWAGMKIIIHPKFVLNDVLKSIRKHRPTFFPAVPAIFNAIATLPNVRKEDFARLKFCMSGGAPLPGDVQRLFEEKTGCRHFGEGYGLTETSPVATFNPAKGKIKNGSVGLPIPGTIVEIINRDDGVSVLPVGEKGEVCISGPQVMKGYFNKPEETSAVLRHGRLHTGDVGYLDDEGYLFLVDRIKDMIIVRGYKVYPRFVEEAIYKHPSV
ncbi:MAG: AMP-binding protein, partial [Proteobacteria bacterium]|nr:AMP-binding protein [Pseudomonadota bacterium]